MKKNRYLIFKRSMVFGLLSIFLLFSLFTAIFICIEAEWPAVSCLIFFFLALTAFVVILDNGTVTFLQEGLQYKRFFSLDLIKAEDVKECRFSCGGEEAVYKKTVTYNISITTHEGKIFLFDIGFNAKLMNKLLEFVPQERIIVDKRCYKIPKRYYLVLEKFLSPKKMKELACKGVKEKI